MKILWIILNTIQIILIFLWTAVCGVTGMLLMLITWNGQWVHLVEGRYLWSPVVCFISGVSVKVEGLENVNRQPAAIYVANHTSHFDILAMARVMPLGLFFVAKKELSRIPIMGQYMKFIGHIFVDRGNKEKAMKSMHEAALKIRAGKNVISFPEGTRSKTGVLGIFKRGSFVIAKDGAIDIVPIAISGSREILKSGSFHIRPGVIKVKIGQRILASSFSNASIEELAELSRNKIQQLLEDIQSN